MNTPLGKVTHFAGEGRKFCVYSHFDPNGKLARYVKFYLEEITACGYDIIFVSTSQMVSDSDCKYLDNLCFKTLFRQNVGYDFSSYRKGIEVLFESGIQVDCLLIANDSVFGPISNLRSIMVQMENHVAEMVGLTDSFDLSYHIQSYFIHFKGNLLSSQVFRNFWDSVTLIDNTTPNFKQEIINRYEVGGTQYFISKGYKVAALFPFSDLLEQHFSAVLKILKNSSMVAGVEPISEFDLQFRLNATHYYWRYLIEIGLPFIKRELLTKNPTNTDISKWPQTIKVHSTYDLTLISDALIDLNSELAMYVVSRSDAEKAIKTNFDTITVSINECLASDRVLSTLPKEMKFRFDEQRYLESYPDVKEAIKSGSLANAISHYHAYGSKENRLFPLIRAE
ncbi:rhamnan synthesis F family protein [Hydrogenophaga sp. PAMC20947]|uniref:rhamnan synthesis F family protein n=1 Tax=Hydrogenophaga sp. PAMC20947 TaxID=2565558 RepID=UPI00109D9EFE|nr:rhamnan synthesis F family protein [Hydrogenophaga sp. PAMC20947]QCB46338.1 hypothetical protein E5678_10070 [Hydrogenophaga sp. PAMC20947]